MSLADDLGWRRFRRRVLRRLPSVGSILRARTFPLRAPTTPSGVELLEKPVRTGAAFDTDWARRRSARVVRALAVEVPLRAAIWLMATPRCRGRDRFEHLDGPVVFVANHHSHADTPLLLTTLPLRWRHKTAVGAAADYFFRGWLSGVVSALFIGAIPVERARVGRRSAELASRLLAEGWNLLIFPEGGRSPDGWGQPFRGGAAYLAKRCGVPVVPIHVTGTDRVLGKSRFLPSPGDTVVTFGQPIHPADGERAHKLAKRIQQAVNALADEARTDWYSARRRAHAGETPALTGPSVDSWRRAWALGGGGPARRDRRRKRPWPPL